MNYAQAIVADFGGIVPYHEILYIRAIEFAAAKARDAFAEFESRLAALAAAELIVFELQEALSHAAAVSRFFWPASTSVLSQARGSKIRTAFAIGDDHPLRSRELRNAIEHFDERLDGFLAIDPMGEIFDLVVGTHDLVARKATHVLRLVDPAAKVVVLFGQVHDYGRIEEAIGQSHKRCARMDANGGRLHHGD